MQTLNIWPRWATKRGQQRLRLRRAEIAQPVYVHGLAVPLDDLSADRKGYSLGVDYGAINSLGFADATVLHVEHETGAQPLASVGDCTLSVRVGPLGVYVEALIDAATDRGRKALALIDGGAGLSAGLSIHQETWKIVGQGRDRRAAVVCENVALKEISIVKRPAFGGTWIGRGRLDRRTVESGCATVR